MSPNARTAGPLLAVRDRLARWAATNLGDKGVFLAGFLKHPVMVGSVIPSSRRLIEHMLRPVDWSRCRLFVEYGPGVGTFCRPVLDRLPRGGRLIVIDTNPDFVEYLRRRFADSRFSAVHGSAADVEAIVAAHGHGAADYVLSGLPFSTLPDGAGPAIAAATERVMAPGGQFLVYQFSPKVKRFLDPHFTRVDHAFEPVNVPPAQLYWAHKNGRPGD